MITFCRGASNDMLTDNYFVKLDGRGVLAVSGEDRADFLQGLVSNDVHSISETFSIYAALLTPQGKFFCDFFMSNGQSEFLLECDSKLLPELEKKLRMHKLRSKINIEDVSDQFDVFAGFGGSIHSAIGSTGGSGHTIKVSNGLMMVDPRLAAMGIRMILTKNTLPTIGNLKQCDSNDYELLRITSGVPDGVQDMQFQKTILLEAGFDELNGINWEKGCYMGQELTARTKYRGLIKRRLIPVSVDGPLPEPGTFIMFGEKEAGEIRSGTGNAAMALMRLNILEEWSRLGGELTAGSSCVMPQKQSWMNF